MNQESTELLELIRACVDGDPDARRRFQTAYGPTVYNFPTKRYSLPLDQAADFYVYAFDHERIFSRIRHFKGHESTQFRHFLWGLVLKQLFIEWHRTLKTVSTISLHTPIRNSAEEESFTLEDVLPDPKTVEAEATDVLFEKIASPTWSSLSPEDQLDLKLLNLLEQDLEAADFRLLAKISGRSLRETLLLVSEVQDSLRHKDEKFSQLHDMLDSTWGWIRLRQKELQEINEKIHSFMATGELASPTYRQLLERKKELEQALVKRIRQRDEICEKMHKNRLTTPYKDLARLRNTTVGTVCSQIARLRERLVRKHAEDRARKEQAS
jgi:hypothetical protein